LIWFAALTSSKPGGRLQLGIRRWSPEQVIDGWRYFGYRPVEGQSDADMGRHHWGLWPEETCALRYLKANLAENANVHLAFLTFEFLRTPVHYARTLLVPTLQ